MLMWLLVEALVSYLETDTLVNSELLPVEHCVKENRQAQGLASQGHNSLSKNSNRYISVRYAFTVMCCLCLGSPKLHSSRILNSELPYVFKSNP